MTEIMLTRHGETDWNVAEIFRGRIDIELNETGVKQAGLLAKYLTERKIDAVYASPLRRALKTAEVIAGNQNLDVGITPGLIDFDYGKWQGLLHREVKAKHKELYTEWVSRPDKIKMPAGENLDDVRKRAIGVVAQVIAEHEGTVVLVSHRVVNKVLICALLGLDNSHFWDIRQDTCGITTFIYEDGRFILTRHNDTTFLKSIQRAPLGDF